MEFERLKQSNFDRWIRALKIDQTYEALREIILLEEFKNAIPDVVRTHVEEQRVKTARLAAEMADDYELVHKSKIRFRHQFQLVRDRNWGHEKYSSGKGKGDLMGGNKESVPQIIKEIQEGGKEMKNFRCFHCNKLGYVKSQCLWLTKNTGKADVVKQDKTVGFVRVVKESPREANEVQTIVQPVQEVIVKKVSDVFKELTCVGKVYSCVSGGAGKEVTILRATGASQSLMVRDEELCSLGKMLPEKVVICGIQGERSSVPLYKVRLESPVKSGEVVVGVIDKLSCPGIQFILGNDTAGSQVEVMPTLVDKPVQNQTTEVLKDEYPGIYPDCVVTRSQSHRLRRGEIRVKMKLKCNYQKRFLIRWLKKNKNRWRMRPIFLVQENWQSYNRKM
ncbi:uncharacterized protein [Scyliorhinus torazame]|uniref:uncharacterized protein n=1 Tax=Scyliorhinus torazame TaxID=75743 RepID=UPI003B5B4855